MYSIFNRRAPIRTQTAPTIHPPKESQREPFQTCWQPPNTMHTFGRVSSFSHSLLLLQLLHSRIHTFHSFVLWLLSESDRSGIRNGSGRPHSVTAALLSEGVIPLRDGVSSHPISVFIVAFFGRAISRCSECEKNTEQNGAVGVGCGACEVSDLKDYGVSPGRADWEP